MKHVPFLLSILAVIAILLIANFVFPKPPELPTISTKPPAPVSMKPTPTPAPKLAPKPADVLENFANFVEAGRYDGEITGSEPPLPIMFNRKDKQILFESEIATDIGKVEYCMVGFGGKAYESILLSYVDPHNLNILLKALKPLPDKVSSLNFSVSDDGKVDDIWPLYKMEVIYFDSENKVARRRIEDFAINQVEDRPAPRQHWAYTGSYFFVEESTSREVWAALISKNICAMYKDTSCLFMTTTKDWQNDDLYIANEEIIPAKGTRVLLLLTMVEE